MLHNLKISNNITQTHTNLEFWLCFYFCFYKNIIFTYQKIQNQFPLKLNKLAIKNQKL